MDKQFWKILKENDFAIPAGQTVTSLTNELLFYLGSPDPELRDEIAYETFANFLERGYYSPNEIRTYIAGLLTNLETGIGEKETDSIFLRAFSVLFLAEIIHNDNKTPQLKKDLIKTILGKGIWYLEAERDPRGYIQGKGWAHALAHTADLLLVLAKSSKTGGSDHKRILNSISEKLVHSTDYVYIHGEDDRLSRAVLEILRRSTLPMTTLKKWLKTFLAPDDGSWKGAWTEEESAYAFMNVRNFLRSLYLQIAAKEELPDREETAMLVLDAVEMLKPY